MSWLRLMLIGLALSVGLPARAEDVCTPLAEPEVTIELHADLADAVVGDHVEFSAEVRDPRRVPVRLTGFELSGWQTRFVQLDRATSFPDDDDSPDPELPFPNLNIHFFAIRRIAAHPGPADLRFGVHYELARGCAEAPTYESRSTWSGPLSLEVIAANACRGDCDGDEQVTADEIQRLIVAALEGSEDDACATAFDPDRSVGVDDLLQATTNALLGCPALRRCGGVDGSTCLGREWCDLPDGICRSDDLHHRGHEGNEESEIMK